MESIFEFHDVKFNPRGVNYFISRADNPLTSSDKKDKHKTLFEYQFNSHPLPENYHKSIKRKITHDYFVTPFNVSSSLHDGLINVTLRGVVRVFDDWEDDDAQPRPPDAEGWHWSQHRGTLYAWLSQYLRVGVV